MNLYEYYVFLDSPVRDFELIKFSVRLLDGVYLHFLITAPIKAVGEGMDKTEAQINTLRDIS